MNPWWTAPEYQERKPMKFPTREGRLREVIRVAPEREKGDRAHKADERVRILTSR